MLTYQANGKVAAGSGSLAGWYFLCLIWKTGLGLKSFSEHALTVRCLQHPHLLEQWKAYPGAFPSCSIVRLLSFGSLCLQGPEQHQPKVTTFCGCSPLALYTFLICQCQWKGNTFWASSAVSVSWIPQRCCSIHSSTSISCTNWQLQHNIQYVFKE